jgi:hypothetical protein
MDKYKFDIDNLLDILNDYLVANNENKYTIEPLTTININLNNIKYIPDDDIKYIINNIFNNKIKYIKNDKIKINKNIISKYIFVRKDHINSIIELHYYKGSPTNMYDYDNIDKLIGYLLSDMIIHKKTKYILLNIFNLDIKSTKINNFLKKYDMINGSDDEYLSVSIKEHYDMNLYEYLNKNTLENIDIMTIKTIIFQVIFTIAMIQNRYPSFRHNKLDLNSIKISSNNNKNNKNDIIFGNNSYHFQDIGLDVKISDFYNSYIETIAENK